MVYSCEHDDEIFGKKPEYGQNNYSDQDDSNLNYQRAVETLNQKILEATMQLNNNGPIVNPKQLTPDDSSFIAKQMTLVPEVLHSEPQVDYPNGGKDFNREPAAYHLEGVATNQQVRY